MSQIDIAADRSHDQLNTHTDTHTHIHLDTQTHIHIHISTRKQDVS